MKTKKENEHPSVRQESNDKKVILPGYPTYPESEDIYKKGKEEKEIDPDDISKLKINEEIGKKNVKDFDDDLSGEDLDVPGSELDDDLEEIGSEDEENNYYSIGGDEHENLEENLER